ncbi:MAG: FISUMP domain-containing protein, partial [Flavobacteriales bacterium]|nr:FISUMP domain-containing protein [Flavobacteriales bacterium]
VLSSPVGSCGAQILAFNNDNSALTLTADGEDASLTPVIENTDDWGIFQTYAILNDGSSDAYYAGGANPDNVHPAFGGVDLGNFSSSETLTLNGGEIKTYKNNSANVCGGNTQYRVYADGDTPGSFNAVSLAYNSDLGSGDQKWSTSNAGIDLLDGLTLGDYTLEIYWDADGDTYGGCGFTNTENNAGANYLASFSLVSYGCTDNTACNYDASATIDDSSCESLSCAGCTDNTACNYDASATIDDSSCTLAAELTSVSLVSGATTLTSTDGEISIVVANGTPVSLQLSGNNSSSDYSFVYPGSYGGIAAGFYSVTLLDASSCSSNAINVIVPYTQCCSGCGIYDSDTDGICDDSDNCINRRATNYADPANEDCIILGCTDTDYIEYNASATNDDGSCSTLIFEGCTNPTAPNYDAAANTDDGSCIIYGCMDQNYIEYNPAANTFNDSCGTLVVEGCTDPDYTEYNASANTDDGSCATAVVYGCTDSAFLEYNASANTDDGSCSTLVGCSDSDFASMDGHNYELVTIGDQCWFAENLRTTLYGNGDVIPAGLTGGEWASTTTDATAMFGEGSSYCVENSPDIDACDATQSLAEYGRLYNWDAVDDARSLCPSGWHVPTDGEWTDLEDFITAQGFSGTEGTALKSTSGWDSGDNGTDDFGFSALPGGRRDNNGNFLYAGLDGYWWSSSPSGGFAWARYLNTSSPAVNRNSPNPRNGFSV